MREPVRELVQAPELELEPEQGPVQESEQGPVQEPEQEPEPEPVREPELRFSARHVGNSPA